MFLRSRHVPYKDVRARVDTTHQVQAPLDFCFKFLTSLADISEEEPNNRGGHCQLVRGEDARYATNALRLCNNTLADITGLAATASVLLQEPENLAWLDLSFNLLTTIDEVICSFQNLKILYLHGNSIENIFDAEKLSRLPRLLHLTLHGNPLEHTRGYRHVVLSFVPGLRTLDFSHVTKTDVRLVSTWGDTMKKSIKKKSTDKNKENEDN